MHEELAPLLRFDVTEQQDGVTLRDVLRRDYGCSRTLLSRIRQDGVIAINGQEAMMWHLLSQGDEVEILLPERASPGVVPENIPIEVIYEDDDLLILDKQPGIVVHPTKGYPRGTLANAIAYYWRQQDLNITVRPIHRLDRETSGLILFAKNAYTDQHLSDQATSGRMKKFYWAITEGAIQPPSGVIDLRIGIAACPDLREVSPKGRVAVTKYATLEDWSDYALLEVELLTGRTHQIRAHLSYLGHPLLSDTRYGASPTPLMERVALHAKRLSFYHPLRKERLTFEAEPHPDMQQAIDALKEKSGGKRPGIK